MSNSYEKNSDPGSPEIDQNTLLTPSRSLIKLSITVGLITCAISMFLIWIFVTLFGAGSFGSIAGAELFKSESIFFIGVMTLCWAPLFESVLGQVIPVELVRTVSTSKIPCITVSAFIFSIGHFSGGAGWGQSFLTFLVGLPLAALYVRFRPQGIVRSFTASAIAHATHNASILFLSYIIVPRFH